jgi:hypothetical protein
LSCPGHHTRQLFRIEKRNSKEHLLVNSGLPFGQTYAPYKLAKCQHRLLPIRCDLSLKCHQSVRNSTVSTPALKGGRVHCGSKNNILHFTKSFVTNGTLPNIHTMYGRNVLCFRIKPCKYLLDE